MFKKRAVIYLAVTFILTIISLVYAEMPQTINYQGYLTDSSGQAVNGTVQMTFFIYDVESGGTSLWSETQSVPMNSGIYNVILGV